MSLGDFLYDQAYLRNTGKCPVDPDFRCAWAQAILSERREIFQSVPPGERKAELATVRDFHRKQIAEMRSDPKWIAAEKVIREYITKRLRDFELWRRPPAGGVQ